MSIQALPVITRLPQQRLAIRFGNDDSKPPVKPVADEGSDGPEAKKALVAGAKEDSGSVKADASATEKTTPPPLPESKTPTVAERIRKPWHVGKKAMIIGGGSLLALILTVAGGIAIGNSTSSKPEAQSNHATQNPTTVQKPVIGTSTPTSKPQREEMAHPDYQPGDERYEFSRNLVPTDAELYGPEDHQPPGG